MECNPKGGLGCQHHLSHHLVALERVWEPLLTWAAHLSKEILEWEEKETSFQDLLCKTSFRNDSPSSLS